MKTPWKVWIRPEVNSNMRGKSSQIWVTQKSRRVYLWDSRSGTEARQIVRWRPDWDWKKCVVVIYEDLQGLLRKSKSSELLGCWAGPVDFVQRYRMQYESKIHFPESHLEIFLRKSLRSHWRTRWKISPRHYVYGKAVPRQLDLKYVGRLLLDTEEGCTWRQIPAKFISLFIL